MRKAIKKHNYVIHPTENRLTWYSVGQDELMEMLLEGSLKDGTILHRGKDSHITFVVSNFGSQVTTWKGTIILDGLEGKNGEEEKDNIP